MGLSRALSDALDESRALLPVGSAWPRDPRSNLDKLLAGLSTWRGRLEVRAEDLLQESDPRTTSELLPDWEDAVGLPDECLPVPGSIAERRALILARLVGEGGGSRAFFESLARAIGYTVTIEEHESDPARCGVARTGVGRCGGDLWDFVWSVRSPLILVRLARCGVARMGDPMGTFGDALLRCVMERAAPAHTLVRFVADGLCYLVILDGDGDPVHVELAGTNLIVRDELGALVMVPIPDEVLVVYDESGDPVSITVTCDEP